MKQTWMIASSFSLILCALLAAPQGIAEGTRESTPDLREACRKNVAGDYLSVFDKAESARQLVLLAESKSKELHSQQTQARAKLEQAQGEYDKKEFDLAAKDKRDNAAALLNAIEMNLADNARMLRQAEADQKLNTTNQQKLEAAMRPVFNIKHAEKTRDGRYTLAISYQASCPKFRFLCPLPAKQNEPLRKLAALLSDPDACERYSHLPAHN